MGEQEKILDSKPLLSVVPSLESLLDPCHHPPSWKEHLGPTDGPLWLCPLLLCVGLLDSKDLSPTGQVEAGVLIGCIDLS